MTLGSIRNRDNYQNQDQQPALDVPWGRLEGLLYN